MASTATSQGYGVPSRPSNLPLPQKVTFPIDFKKLMCTVVIHLFLICSIYQKYFFLSAVLSALVFSLFISFFMGYNLSNQLKTSVPVHSISPLSFCWGGNIHSSNPNVVTGICDPNNSPAWHHRRTNMCL